MVVCGLGKISNRVSNGCLYAKNMNLYGFMSSDLNKAKSYRDEFQAAKAFDSMHDLYADSNVDVLYLCTPNDSHYHLIKDALEHRKHVICEKLIVPSIKELSELFALAKTNSCFLMEAHKMATSPLLSKIKSMIQDGVIGDLYYIKAEYSFDIRTVNIPENHWLLQESAGCCKDIGVYSICFANYFASEEIKKHLSVKSGYLDYPCDFFFQSLIEYKNQVKASVTSSWLYTAKDKGCGYLYGTKGYFKIPAYWKGKDAQLFINGKTIDIHVEFKSDFTAEIEHAANCIMNLKIESDIISYEFSKKILEIVES